MATKAKNGKRSTVKRVSKALTKYVRGVLGKKNPTWKAPGPWKPTADVPLGYGYSVRAAYGDYTVRLGGESVGTVNGGYYQTRRDVLEVAREIAKEHREKNKKRNPGRRHYHVSVPATKNDRGYLVKILAPSAASAKAHARKYCAKRQGVALSKFHLPKGTTVKAV